MARNLDISTAVDLDRVADCADVDYNRVVCTAAASDYDIRHVGFRPHLGPFSHVSVQVSRKGAGSEHACMERLTQGGRRGRRERVGVRGLLRSKAAYVSGRKCRRLGG